MTDCIKRFLSLQDVEYSEKFDIARLSSIGIGGRAKIAAMPNTEEKLKAVIDFLFDRSLPYKIVGRMTNILPQDEDYDGVLILTNRLNRYSVNENACSAQCGVVFSKMLYEISALSLGGASTLYGIPGSVGGMIVNNAGAFGNEISDFIIGARIYDPRSKIIEYMPRDDLGFAYRSSNLRYSPLVIISADFSFIRSRENEIKNRLSEIITLRKSAQPYSEMSLGSIFKRTSDVSVGYLIDKLGLKGYSIGGAMISDKHAGFIVNSGGATADDVKRLITFIKTNIKNKYGTEIEEEIEFM